jgi:hypothetical protein
MLVIHLFVNSLIVCYLCCDWLATVRARVMHDVIGRWVSPCACVDVVVCCVITRRLFRRLDVLCN